MEYNAGGYLPVDYTFCGDSSCLLRFSNGIPCVSPVATRDVLSWNVSANEPNLVMHALN